MPLQKSVETERRPFCFSRKIFCLRAQVPWEVTKHTCDHCVATRTDSAVAKALQPTYRISVFQPSDRRDGLPCGHARPVEVTAYVHLGVVDMLYPFRKRCKAGTSSVPPCPSQSQGSKFCILSALFVHVYQLFCVCLHRSIFYKQTHIIIE